MDERVVFMVLSGTLLIAILYRIGLRAWRLQHGLINYGREVLLSALLLPKLIQFVLAVLIWWTYTPNRDVVLSTIPLYDGFDFADLFHWMRNSIATVDFILILYFLNGELVLSLREVWCKGVGLAGRMRQWAQRIFPRS